MALIATAGKISIPYYNMLRYGGMAFEELRASDYQNASYGRHVHWLERRTKLLGYHLAPTNRMTGPDPCWSLVFVRIMSPLSISQLGT